MTDSVRLPDFLIVGAAKSGTTSLQRYLEESNEIYFTRVRKEPCFFAFRDSSVFFNGPIPADRIIKSDQQYHKLYKNIPCDRIVGESSTPYLYMHEESIRNIKIAYSGRADPVIVILLRNPIKRAYSQYMMNVRDGYERLSFSDALKVEQKRSRENWHIDFMYFERGLYWNQVKAYLESFSRVYIQTYEHFVSDPCGSVNAVRGMVGLDPVNQVGSSKIYNASGVPKSRFLSGLINSSFSKIIGSIFPKYAKEVIKGFVHDLNLKKVPMSDDDYLYLARKYSYDIDRLSLLLEKDLRSFWGIP